MYALYVYDMCQNIINPSPVSNPISNPHSIRYIFFLCFFIHFYWVFKSIKPHIKPNIKPPFNYTFIFVCPPHYHIAPHIKPRQQPIYQVPVWLIDNDPSDKKIFRSINDHNDPKILQDDLNILKKWSNTWLLKFHPDKCKRMTIGKPNEFTDIIYTLDKNRTIHNLENVEQEKDIGVIIDSNLEFDKHINAKINKANSMFSIIRRSFQFLNHQPFTPLYKSLVRSHLDYASSVWNPYKQKHIEAIENVQKRATKQLPNMSDLSYEERLRKLHLPTLTFRRIRGDMIETYKIMHEIYDKDVTTFFKLRNQETERTSLRSHKYQLYIEPINKNIRK